ncbi:hypothetical protein ACFQ21_29070 [Ohtaekwangia kribbensis]|uniref:Uncharacterized protein n=1 Tax=Ohtaekwangia kribbensis TaxID=688913 RepID=A0ABW3KE15_9BACT
MTTGGRTNYYLPGEIGGEYMEFKMTLKNDLIVMNDDRLKHTIRFGFGYDYLRYRIHPMDRHFLLRENEFKYLGKRKDFVLPFDRFIPLYPLDLLIMDFCYKEFQACFVGLTPVFGQRKQSEQQ